MIPSQHLKLAAIKANSVRRRLGLSIDSYFCVFDACQKLGVDLRLSQLDSVEAMFCKSAPPTIILSTSRPDARRRFSCAHELGHWALGHSGGAVDLVSASDSSRKRPVTETAADFFAGELLMPKLLLSRAIRDLGTSPSILDFFELACAIGVGLSTLRFHIQNVAQVEAPFPKSTSSNPLDDVRSIAQLSSSTTPLIAVGSCWKGRPIDLDQGSFILARHGCETTFAKSKLVNWVSTNSAGALFQAVCIGVENGEQSVRVMGNDYEGRAVFRYGIGLADESV